MAMLFVSILLGSFGQILLKKGMQVATSPKALAVGGAAVMEALKSIMHPMVFFGFVCYGVSSILWLMILKKIPLSTAYPLISFSYVLVVVLSAIILKEHVKWGTTVPGLLLIMGGVSLIGLGMGGK